MEYHTRAGRTRAGLAIALAVTVLVVCGGAGCRQAHHVAPGGSAPAAISSPGPATTLPTPSMPRRDLGADEARGGHTLARHVGLSDEQLRARLRRERRISAASTWTDRETAERAVQRVLVPPPRELTRWLARTGPRPNLALSRVGDGAEIIGRSLVRGARRVVDCRTAVVVLKWDTSRGDFFVLTAYPEAEP